MTPREIASNGFRAFLGAMNIEVRGIHQAAYLLALFALLSQLLALVRDRLLASSFGATETLDVYYAAFRVPDLLFATVASLSSLRAPPVLSRLKRRKGSAGFLKKSFFSFSLALAVLLFDSSYLAPLVAPGIRR